MANSWHSGLGTKIDAEYVVRMEDVLYPEETDPQRPGVCFD
jgi:hypothetical protein